MLTPPSRRSPKFLKAGAKAAVAVGGLAKARAASSSRARFDAQVEDEARFFRSWIERPLVTGAVSPSGKVLARTMARYVDPQGTGPVIELGPGTGPVTDALIKRGVSQDRLVLVEFNPDFAKLLGVRFPKARIIRGDAYDLARSLEGVLAEPAAACVSSLPLLTKPESQRLRLLADAFSHMRPNAPFIQFTYMPGSPVPRAAGGFRSESTGTIWLNLPPARVWVYRRA